MAYNSLKHKAKKNKHQKIHKKVAKIFAQFKNSAYLCNAIEKDTKCKSLRSSVGRATDS